MKKIVVIVPARNEEKTIGNIIDRIQKSLHPSTPPIVVIDDNTCDRTALVAQNAGATVIDQGSRRGLAEAFKAGVREALGEDADIVVNIDADGQYLPEDIPRLVAPLMDGKADIVLGSRFAGGIEEMPIAKKIGNLFFTWITKRLANTTITDSQTGFRAMTRRVAQNLNIQSDYTYTQEMIIEAAFKGFKIREEPIFFARRRSGKSRLIPSMLTYALKVTKTMAKCYVRNMKNARRM